jgi:hypothetical protein
MLNVRDAISQVLDKQSLADIAKMDCQTGKAQEIRLKAEED